MSRRLIRILGFVLIYGLMIGWGLSSARGEYQAKGKRDVFVPLVTADGRRIHPPGTDEEETISGLDGLVLQGLVFDPKAEAYALINGHIVREQEEIGGIKVLKIEPTTVKILADGKPVQLTVYQPTEERTEEP